MTDREAMLALDRHINLTTTIPKLRAHLPPSRACALSLLWEGEGRVRWSAGGSFVLRVAAGSIFCKLRR